MALLQIDYPMVVVGVDPGVTTGVAIYGLASSDKYPVLLSAEQWGNPESVSTRMRELLGKYKNVVFVIERFDKRPGVVDPDYTPMFIINDINRDLPDATIVWQTPSQAKNLVKPARRGVPDGLKRWGWYEVGKGHANDASRHVITFLVEKLAHIPTIKRGWPPRGDS